MTLDFSPTGFAAPRKDQVLAHARTEASLIMRNGEQAILALVIPVAILIAGRWFAGALGLEFAATVPSVLALAIWSSCFTSLAISTGFERRYNVLERLAATPLGKTGILLGKSLGIAMITAGQVAVLAAIALALGWRPGLAPAHLLVALLSAVLAMAAFAGLALSLSGTARPEVTLAVANLVYLIGMAAGLLLPVARYPGWLQPIVAGLPTGALGEAMRSGSVLSIPILLAWCVVGLLVSRKVFSWTS
ncbi:ABC transporter permease [Tessaracoccus sp. OS52]|uniref:ABC transporter permease n=1 Tax=Tessaracoccus sp. OS52 TaxID=2886691 RepID=UPI001D127C93|nr:ABC transporter permease [Tessaracoccus sp. OS52]MCC2593343.1 ABC transporter permease [Tessaracoccus sp. OS52]